MTQYFEDVEVGNLIPAMVQLPSTQQLVQWAGASGDFNPIHYDLNIARERNLPGIVIHGLLKFQFLVEMLSVWAGHEGQLRNIAVRYLSMDRPGERLVCSGTVTAKQCEDGLNLVSCDIWLDNQSRHERTVTGTATIALPSRATGKDR